MGRSAREREVARHDAVRQRAARVLADVAAIGQDRGPRVSLELLSKFPTSEFWLRHENRMSVGGGHNNPLVTGELSGEDKRVSAAAAAGELRTGRAVLEQIDLVNLVEAKRAFAAAANGRAADEGHTTLDDDDNDDGLVDGALTLEEFIAAFARVCDVPIHELAHLFMKIDHNSDGLVSWDEFLSFVIQSEKGQEASRRMEGAQLEFEPQPRFAGPQPNAHSQRISKILFIPSRNHYVTTANDSSVRVWDGTTLKHLHTAAGSSWINDMVCLPDLATNKLVVASADRTVSFYEMATADPKRQYALYGRIVLLDLPLCLATWVQGAATPVLGCGDDTGCVSVFDARVLVQLVSRAGEGRKPLDSGQARKAKLYTLKLHSDWVTTITYVPHLHALLSSGLDSAIKLTVTRQLDAHGDGVLSEGELTTLHTLRGHTKGVHALVTLAVGGRQLGVSASLDRRVLVWNLETGDEMACLEGHRSYVQQVCADEANERLITLASDCEIRVWELATFSCAQAISPLGRPALSQCAAICYNAQHQCLVTGARELTLWQPRKFVIPLDVIRATALGPHGHKVPLVAVLHSELYQLAVTADESSIVSVWSVHTGRQLFRFEHKEARLTCMAFDCTLRRLVTGADDGAVRMFNFSSGELLQRYAAQTGGHIGETRHDEISAVLHVDVGGQEVMCAVGWSRQLWLWFRPSAHPAAAAAARGATGSPVRKPAAAVQLDAHVLHGHKADVLCIGFVPPSWLVRAALHAAPARARTHNACRPAALSAHPLGSDSQSSAPCPHASAPPAPASRTAQATGSYDGEVILWDLLRCELKRRLTPAHRPLPALTPLQPPRFSQPQLPTVSTPPPFRRKSTLRPVGAAVVAAASAGGSAGAPASARPARDEEELRLSASIERIAFLVPAQPASGGRRSQQQLRSSVGGLGASATSPLVVTVSAEGVLRFWHMASGHLLLELEAACEPNESLTALAIEETNTFLVTGDSGGYVRLWDVAAMADYSSELPAALDVRSAAYAPPPSESVRVLLTWRAHTRSVIAAEYLTGISGFLTAGADCTARMWSLAGEQIGVFGQAVPWDLAERSTWLDSEAVQVGVPSRHKDLPLAEVPLTDILPPPIIASLFTTLSGRRLSHAVGAAARSSFARTPERTGTRP